MNANERPKFLSREIQKVDGELEHYLRSLIDASTFLSTPRPAFYNIPDTFLSIGIDEYARSCALLTEEHPQKKEYGEEVHFYGKNDKFVYPPPKRGRNTVLPDGRIDYSCVPFDIRSSNYTRAVRVHSHPHNSTFSDADVALILSDNPKTGPLCDIVATPGIGNLLLFKTKETPHIQYDDIKRWLVKDGYDSHDLSFSSTYRVAEQFSLGFYQSDALGVYSRLS